VRKGTLLEVKENNKNESGCWYGKRRRIKKKPVITLASGRAWYVDRVLREKKSTGK